MSTKSIFFLLSFKSQIMKHFIYFIFLLSSYTAKAQPSLLYGQKILPAGKVVFLRSDQTLKSSAAMGKTVAFKVMGNVSVDGYDLISHDAMAMGKVKEIVQSSYNYPEQIIIVLQYVQAKDGQMLAINGEFIVTATHNGEEAILNPLETTQANVINNTIIKAF